MTFYKKFEGQNTATDRLCDICFGSLRYLKFVAHSMMCVFVKILLRKILRRSSLSQLIRLNDLRLSRLDTYFFFFFKSLSPWRCGTHNRARLQIKCLPLREHCESKVSCSRRQRIVPARSRTQASRRGVQCTDHYATTKLEKKLRWLTRKASFACLTSLLESASSSWTSGNICCLKET